MSVCLDKILHERMHQIERFREDFGLDQPGLDQPS
jgi:hypothetical protein